MKTCTILDEFKKIRSRNPIIFLDYDGTLVPIIPDPEKAVPDKDLLDLLVKVKQRYELYIVTGRSLGESRRFFGSDYNIIALHGAVVSKDDGSVITCNGYEKYREICDRIFERSAEIQSRFPGIRLFNKHGGLVFTLWHAEPGQYGQIEDEVSRLASETGMAYYRGKMITELRIPGINKGKTIKEMRNGRPALIAGDDSTDEDSFRLNGDAISIKIGDGNSAAKFKVDSYLDLREVLSQL